MAEHGGNIIEGVYTNSVLGSQEAAATAITTTWNGNTQLAGTGAGSVTDTFTLTQTTALDFCVDD
jgi:hypothetical protein